MDNGIGNSSSENAPGAQSKPPRLQNGKKEAAAKRLLAKGYKQYVDEVGALIEKCGFDIPTIEIRTRNLTVETDALVGSSAVRNVVSSLYQDTVDCCVGENSQPLTILKDINIVLKPGTATLLLGPPGAGKSALLQCLGGKMVPSDVLRVSGSVLYNGRSTEEFQVPSTVGYVHQVDNHEPVLTVRETIRFAGKCRGNKIQQLLAEELRKRLDKDPHFLDEHDEQWKQNLLHAFSAGVQDEVTIAMLGLSNCADTIVGDELTRGISGGEKKRVTTGEMITGNTHVLLLDQISTGLDSATTFSITDSLVHLTHVLKLTTVSSLLQPPPETYDLFDEVLLLGNGHVLYQGRRKDVLPYFAKLGFHKPFYVETADFLQQITTASGQRHFYHPDPENGGLKSEGASKFIIPLSDLALSYANSDIGQQYAHHAQSAFPPNAEQDAALEFRRYSKSYKEIASAVFKRWIVLVSRDKNLFWAKITQNVILGIVIGTLFYDTNDYISIFGVLFSCSLFMTLAGFPHMAIAFNSKKVFLKQRDAHFFPPSLYTLTAYVVYLPYALMDAVLFSCIVYFMVGLSTDGAGPFFTFVLILFSMASCTTALFRMIGDISPTMVLANAAGGALLLILIMSSGFTILRPSIPDWWIWSYYISPFAYTIRSLAINEMTTSRWAGGEGQQALEEFGIFTSRLWIWMGILALWGFYALYALISHFSLTYTSGPKKRAFLSASAAAVSETKEKLDYRKLALNFVPVTLAFKDLKYFVPRPGKSQGHLQLLDGISGYAKPGTLTALMGSTGAGKTTLMDVLAGRKTSGTTEGEININGHPKEQKSFRRIMGYVEQIDSHSAFATVKETLQFSAALRLGQDVDRSQKMDFVEDILYLIELHNISDLLVGMSPAEGISLEQRKRLSIGVELVANPSILFMDEPTSGLDAYAAGIVMKAVQNIAASGRTVICTIHQPSSEIFLAFTHLLVLQKGGQTVFFGPQGHECETLIRFLESMPGTVPLKEGINPANWMLEVVNGGTSGTVDVDYAHAYNESQLRADAANEVEALLQPQSGDRVVEFDEKFSAPWSTQFSECLKKNVRSYWRNPSFNTTRYVMTVVLALIYGSMYWDVGNTIQNAGNVQDVLGALFNTAVFLGVFNMDTIQPVVFMERSVFYRERASGTYGVLPYTLALQIVEIPYLIVQSVLYTSIAYFMINFEHDVGKFFFVMLVIALNLHMLSMVGILIATITAAEHIASLVGAFFLTLWIQFCGFVQRQPNIPSGWIWMYWITPLSYTLYGLSAGLLGDNFSVIEVDNTMQTVSSYLDTAFGFAFSFRWWSVGVLLLFGLVFQLCTFLALWKVSFHVR